MSDENARKVGQSPTAPETVEFDPRYADILDVGYGIPSWPSDVGSVAIARIIDWWDVADVYVPDVDNLIAILQNFKAAVEKDPTLIDFPEKKCSDENS